MIPVEHHGFGEHVWEIDINGIPDLLYWCKTSGLLFSPGSDFLVYLCEVLYVVTIALIKTSILLFYLQVFPLRSFRIQCWSVMGFCAVCSLVFTIVTIFQCHPLSYAWNKNIHGTCIDYNRAAWANAAFNILQELLILALPISEIRKLQLERKKKIGLYIMFGLGGLWVSVNTSIQYY